MNCFSYMEILLHILYYWTIFYSINQVIFVESNTIVLWHSVWSFFEEKEDCSMFKEPVKEES